MSKQHGTKQSVTAIKKLSTEARIKLLHGIHKRNDAKPIDWSGTLHSDLESDVTIEDKQWDEIRRDQITFDSLKLFICSNIVRCLNEADKEDARRERTRNLTKKQDEELKAEYVEDKEYYVLQDVKMVDYEPTMLCPTSYPDIFALTTAAGHNLPLPLFYPKTLYFITNQIHVVETRKITWVDPKKKRKKDKVKDCKDEKHKIIHVKEMISLLSAKHHVAEDSLDYSSWKEAADSSSYMSGEAFSIPEEL